MLATVIIIILKDECSYWNLAGAEHLRKLKRNNQNTCFL